MDEHRRSILCAGLALGAVAVTSSEVRAATSLPKLDPIPPLSKSPTPGKPGDFDFLMGEWRIRNWQPKPDSSDNLSTWTEFAGEATVYGILAGIGSVEELRIPARNFSGMGLRLLDVEKKLWIDHWVNARSGVIATPGMSGSFENGAGIFVSDDEEDGKSVLYVGVWDLITARSCRWRQAASRDSGKSWKQSWIMEWQRV